ncbi:MAG: rRNA pseudouridine synthase [Paludibacteraceae bacterium]|nr:rRNA pseudouridine synthase [Paludibacteraceae bacterium]
MYPNEEEWQKDSGRNYSAENNEGEPQRERKSFNPNFSNDNRVVRNNADPSVKRPRRRIGESTRYNMENDGEYQNNRPYRPNNRYNNNGGGYDNNGGGYNNRNYNNYRDNDNQGNGNYEGEYRPNNRYNNNGGGYNNNRGGGYNNNRGGGYNNNRGGGYNNNRGGGFKKGGNNKQFKNITRPIEYRSIVEDPNEQIRLNKFLANAGICSRREADELIQAGVVTVNGVTVSELGTKILRGDKVMIHDQLVSPDKRIYLLLNKPKDCVTSNDDPYAKLTVLDIVKNACHERIYPVGRLDRNTTGVLLLTNDGDLAAKLTHPKYNKKKIYQVTLDKGLTQDDYDKIMAGIMLEDGEIKADEISFLDEDEHRKIGIEIHSGRNRIVRRIFEHLGYKVVRLDRVYFAGLTKKNLKRGQWRFLSEKEVNMLRMGAFE